MNDLGAEHFCEVLIDGVSLDIYEIFTGDQSDGFEVYDEHGNCLNEGNIFDDVPTPEDLRDLIQKGR